MCFELEFEFPDNAPPDWMKQMPLEIQIAIKMLNLDFCSTFASITTPLIEIGESLLIGQDIAKLRQNLPTIGWDKSIKRLVIINQK